MEKENKKELTENQQKKLKHLGIRKKIKLMSYTTKMYNLCCNKCKHHILYSPSDAIDKVCPKCLIEISPILKDIERLCK